MNWFNKGLLMGISLVILFMLLMAIGSFSEEYSHSEKTTNPIIFFIVLWAGSFVWGVASAILFIPLALLISWFKYKKK